MAAVATIGLVAAVVMGLLWTSARAASSSARAERDAAQLEIDTVRDSRMMAADALIELQSELTEVRAENRRLQDGLDDELAAASYGEPGTPAPMAVDVRAELDAEVRDLTARNEALTTSVAALEQRLADMAAAAAAEPAPPAPFDVETAPDFARYLGEILSSRRGSSPLSSGESTCFGTTVVDLIGLDAIGRGLHLGANRADNNVVVQAMQDAAAACSIDPALIF